MDTIISNSIKLLLIIIINSISITTTFAQGHNPVFNPEDTFSFVRIKIMKPGGTPYANSTVVLKGKKGHIVTMQTGADGKVKAKVPFNDTYFVHTDGNVCYQPLVINNFPYITYHYQAYTKQFVYYTFNYTKPTGSPLVGEEVIIHSLKTGMQYKDSTDANGQIRVYLPFESEFRVSVKYHDVATMIYPEDGSEYRMMSFTFRWMGSEERAKREVMMDSLSKVKHLATTGLLDSLVKNNLTDVIIKKDIFIPVDYDSIEWVTKMLQAKADAYKKELAANPNHLEEKEKAVLAPLYRLRKTYAKKIIVTDVTGSMLPYIEQVLLWHALNFMDNEGTKYLFFNDGDRKPTKLKKIGSAGGLYSCKGTLKDFKHVINTMRKGINGGNGGDGPENDIEALLEAIRQKSKYDEVILIADNFSSIRDISLVSQLNAPIRVIVCGIEGSSWGKIHGISEEYLNLARLTGGSIHTVKEDIYDLAEIKEGETIVIDDVTYFFNDGRFEREKKM